MPYRDLKVFDATECAVDRVNSLIDGPSGGRMLYAVQLRRSAQAISANIGEAFGRGEGRDRTRILRIARGEAEEGIRPLTANYRANRIAPAQYWTIRNVLAVIVKMLSALIRSGTAQVVLCAVSAFRS